MVQARSPGRRWAGAPLTLVTPLILGHKDVAQKLIRRAGNGGEGKEAGTR